MYRQSANKIFNITLALTGIFQATSLVNTIATTGECSEEAFEESIKSIFSMDPPNVLSIYGGLKGLRFGFPILLRVFQNRHYKNERNAIRYFIEVTQLAKKLAHEEEKQIYLLHSI